MSIFHIKCECGNKISKFGWNQKLEKTKDGKFEDIKTCKNCGTKYIKINPLSFFITAWNILLTIPLSFFAAYPLIDYIEKFTKNIIFFYIVVFVFFVIFTILFFVIDHIYYKKYLEKE